VPKAGNVRVVDTSVFIGVERGSAPAQAHIAELMRLGELAVSVVTVFELTRGGTTPVHWQRHYAALFGGVALVLPVTQRGAELAAEAARLAGGRVPAPDALIAGTALEHRLSVVTSDADFLRFPGLEVAWVAKAPRAHEPEAAWVASAPEHTAVAARLRAVRRAAGLRGSEVARAAGMARSNYARLEAGRHLPSLATLQRVAAALRVPAVRLLEG